LSIYERTEAQCRQKFRDLKKEFLKVVGKAEGFRGELNYSDLDLVDKIEQRLLGPLEAAKNDKAEKAIYVHKIPPPPYFSGRTFGLRHTPYNRAEAASAPRAAYYGSETGTMNGCYSSRPSIYRRHHPQDPPRCDLGLPYLGQISALPFDLRGPYFSS
jgi:hypothetical protein